MFGFRRRKSQADVFSDVMDEAIDEVAAKWRYFCEVVPYQNAVPLVDRIAAFSFPMTEGLQKSFPVLKDSPEGAVFVLIVKGIERSGTHPGSELYDALGMPPLPD